MLIDQLNIREGSFIKNPVIPSGFSYPTLPNIGELFFRVNLGIVVAYDGSAWVEIAKASRKLVLELDMRNF
jgi:hypothetical protein